MTILVSPHRHRLGADTAIGRFLGDEPSGVAIDFTTMTALIRDADAPLTQYYGDVATLLTYTAPPTKWIYDITGLLVSGTTIRCDYDPITHTPLGILCENARNNIVLWNRDLTNVVWAKTNITAAKDQTGVDGVANSASSILATAANATCLQSVTIVVQTRTQSAYVKRLIGSGIIEATQDNGTTWTTLPVTSSWVRLSNPSASVTNPVLGFRIVTSGDKIAVDFVQNEVGTFVSSPILTTTLAISRAYDNISLPVTLFPYNVIASTLFAAGNTRFLNPASSVVAALADGTINNRLTLILALTNGTQSQINVNSGGVAQAVFTNMGSIPTGSEVRLAVAAEANNFAAITNSVNPLVTDTAGIMPATATVIYMGVSHTSAESLNGYVKRVKYLPRRVSNNELEKMVI